MSYIYYKAWVLSPKTFKQKQNKNHKTKEIKTYFKEAFMASFAMTASLHRACSSHQVTKKQQSTHPKPTRLLGTKQPMEFLSLDVEEQKDFGIAEVDKDEEKQGGDGDESALKFVDGRWKKGTWDLNMFVKDEKWIGMVS